MTTLVDILAWIGTNLIGQPIILLGIVGFIGLWIQKKPISDILTSTFKIMIGVGMMIAGATLFVQELLNFQNLIGSAAGIQPKYPPGYISLNDLIANFGSYAAIIMTIGFIIHLIIAYVTPLKFVYLTGHLMWWVSLTVTATLLTINPNMPPWMIIGIGSIVMALYWSIQPAYIHGAMRAVMQSDEIAYGHTSSFAAWLAFKLGKFVGKPEESTEAIKFPKGLEFFKDYAVSTAIILGLIMIIAAIVGWFINPTAAQELAGDLNPIVWAFIRGIYFAISIVVLLTGVRMFIAEIVPAFRGIATRVIPGVRPALDCPVVFPRAPTAVIIGFISGLIVFLIFMGIFIATGFAIIVPPMIMLFFPGGAAAVFGNTSGGWKGAILGGAINGAILAIGQALTLPALTYGPELATLADPDWYIIIWLLKGLLGPFLGS
ncbi:MAG: PTS ascorbate transporter subunit IIC [Thermoprotei archaeon]